MTSKEEDALYSFLDNTSAPFTLKDVTNTLKDAMYRARRRERIGRLQGEIANLFNNRRIAFPVRENKWLSRRGLFNESRFVITPTRSELLSGILIPGHRCVPFANPSVPPQSYKFFWNDKTVDMLETEGSPEEFYPFFSIYGEEYAPQYIAQENQQNELAYNADPFEEPEEVSIKALDMRNIYREESFVPGDRFVVTIQDWKNCSFRLQRVAADAWEAEDLKKWMDIAEDAFFQSFRNLGPGHTTDEQIAWAYFYGGRRMIDVPAYSLEDFLFEKTDKFSVTAFGLESRFWYAGKDIPDYRSLQGIKTQSDETPIEGLLFQHNIPISEYVVQSYIRDAIYRNENNADGVLERVAPPSCGMNKWDTEYLLSYISETMKELRRFYSVFTDQKAGPIRQEVCELHTAIIDLACRLRREGIDYSILPKHTFIILSQIQIYTSNILEDLDVEEEPPISELSAIDNSIDEMIDIFDEIKDMIDKSRAAFRQTNLTLVRDDDKSRAWRAAQISIGGTDVWRRLILPQSFSLADLHSVILKLFSWSGLQTHRFTLDYVSGGDMFDGERAVKENITIKDLASHYLNEINYEYGTRWTVKIIFSPHNDTNVEKPVCVAGENSPPPERVDGPLRFRRFISALEINDESEKKLAHKELGPDFDPFAFNIDECNRRLDGIIS
jgi:hypothetical protein